MIEDENVKVWYVNISLTLRSVLHIMYNILSVIYKDLARDDLRKLNFLFFIIKINFQILAHKKIKVNQRNTQT